jgi:hypothetical protein
LRRTYKRAVASLEEAETWFEDWLEAMDENDELLERLEDRDNTIRELLADRERLLEELALRRRH